jgi:hypothetical protein
MFIKIYHFCWGGHCDYSPQESKTELRHRKKFLTFMECYRDSCVVSGSHKHLSKHGKYLWRKISALGNLASSCSLPTIYFSTPKLEGPTNLRSFSGSYILSRAQLNPRQYRKTQTVTASQLQPM